MISADELRRQLSDLADRVPPGHGDSRRAVRRRYRRRRLAQGAAAVTMVAAAGTVAAFAVDAGHGGQVVHVDAPANATSTIGTSSTSTVTVPPGVMGRSAILARYPPSRPGITVQAKLVTVDSLAQADPGLTQCQIRGCAPGQYVWLVLLQGPPGSFPHSGPADVTLPAGADAWMLIPVNAGTGVAQGDSEIGGQGQLATSAWGKLRDLDS